MILSLLKSIFQKLQVKGSALDPCKIREITEYEYQTTKIFPDKEEDEESTGKISQKLDS